MAEKLHLNFEELCKHLPGIKSAGWGEQMLSECAAAGLLDATTDGEDAERFYCVESTRKLLELRRIKVETGSEKDKYLVCKSCMKALCVSDIAHSNVLLLYLFDHENCELSYVAEGHPTMDGCDVYLEYVFHDPRPAFHLPSISNKS